MVLTFVHPRVILDASCAITLYASRRMLEIVKTMPIPIAIDDYVYRTEMLTITGSTDMPREKIDIEQLVTCGVIEIVTLEPGDEEITAINFSAFGMDNGEAFTSAIAVNRNWAVAIDDRPAISCLKREAPQIQRISTPEIIQHWAHTTSTLDEVIGEVLRNIEKLGKYTAPRDHSLREWWQHLIAK